MFGCQKLTSILRVPLFPWSQQVVSRQQRWRFHTEGNVGATTYQLCHALPGRWSTLKSYSASCSSQRATCPSGSLKLRNQRRQLWSVRTSN
ncbi:hypothetical protein T03_2181 [Trichinella britovi]|uniref:Uncharacterized protein n=1 Tax=Trichinella britovi TaxID=45882 RepID=A0A0V1DEJ7_TRIBR|nr:hypothetical protein T03_2181 [Trichinella britovi]